jgi:putative addiction module component (TIGR02574 family)
VKIQELSVSERIILAQELWESVLSSGQEPVLTKVQESILDERLSALAADGNRGSSWESVKNRILKS